jgi:hypothetical protein
LALLRHAPVLPALRRLTRAASAAPLPRATGPERPRHLTPPAPACLHTAAWSHARSRAPAPRASCARPGALLLPRAPTAAARTAWRRESGGAEVDKNGG